MVPYSILEPEYQNDITFYRRPPDSKVTTFILSVLLFFSTSLFDQINFNLKDSLVFYTYRLSDIIQQTVHL